MDNYLWWFIGLAVVGALVALTPAGKAIVEARDPDDDPSEDWDGGGDD